MSEQRTITVYPFEELADEPKQRVLEKIKTWAQEDINSLLEEDVFAPALARYGFPTDNIEWSLSYCQGDGMAFYGSVDLPTYLKKRGLWQEFRHFVKSADVEAVIVKNSFGHHYSHWNTMEVEARYWGTETDLRNARFEKLREMLKEDIQMVSRELERAGYKALEVSEEDVKSICDNNEYRFLRSGQFAPSS